MGVKQRGLKSNKGFCSVFHFDWERERKFFTTLRWSTQSPKSSKFLSELIEEISSLSNSTNLRPKFDAVGCDKRKVQWVNCNLLYFPRSEHRCQTIKRLYALFDQIQLSCNDTWYEKFWPKMQFLLQNNKYGRQR